MGTKTYTRMDDNNIAVVEIQEIRNIINKDSLLKQKKEIVDKHKELIDSINEALAQFKE